MHLRSVIRSTGSYLPETIVTNDDLALKIDTSDEWITQRTGIRARCIAGPHEPTSFMAAEAGKRAMESGNCAVEDIDAVIVATTTADQSFPSVAVKVQSSLKLKIGPAFDVQAVCSGFVYALSIANAMILSGMCNRILVIGAEKMSSLIDWEDRTTCVLFGDGAGAVILERGGQDSVNYGGSGILSTHLYANGELRDLLYTDGGIASTGTSGHIVMHGREVFKNAVSYMAEIVEEVLKKIILLPIKLIG